MACAGSRNGGVDRPVLIITDAHLLSMESRAALLWRGDHAGCTVAFAVPFMSPDDIRVSVKGRMFIASVVDCLPSIELYRAACTEVPDHLVE